MCGFAVFSDQLLSALGLPRHRSIRSSSSPSARSLCWLIAYKDIRVSSILTLAARGGLGGLHPGPGLRRALQARLPRRHPAAHAEAASTCAAWAWPSSPASSPSSGSRAPTALGGEAKNAKRTVPKAVIASLSPPARSWSSWPTSRSAAPATTARRSDRARRSTCLAQAYGVSAFKIPVSHRRHGELLLALALLPERRLTDHVPDGPARHLLRVTSGGRTPPTARRTSPSPSTSP